MILKSIKNMHQKKQKRNLSHFTEVIALTESFTLTTGAGVPPLTKPGCMLSAPSQPCLPEGLQT